MKDKDRCLGFYSLSKTRGNDGYLGALLVTDLYGRPLEFRVTLPVKPTPFQRPLYGETLEPFIGVELCGRQLLKHTDHRLELLVVNQRYLLEMRGIIAYPVVHIEKAGEAIEVKADTVVNGSWTTEQVNSPSGRFQPIFIRTASDHADDLPRSRLLVEEAFAHTDLVEPFERIAQALVLLAKEDKRFA